MKKGILLALLLVTAFAASAFALAPIKPEDQKPVFIYVGPVADHINRAVGAAGGALRCEDLHLHRTDFEPTIETTYRGWRIHQTGLPSQGMILLEALNIAECEPASHLAEINAHAVHMSAELLKLAYADRLAYACDPKFAPTPLDSLLSKTWARRRYEAIDRLRASETAMAGALADGDTTYLCAADGEGGMVSLIQSVSSAFGSGAIFHSPSRICWVSGRKSGNSPASIRA